MAKLRSELDLVHVNMTVLRELIAQMKPGNNGKEPPEDFYFINVRKGEYFSKLIKVSLHN